VHVVSQRAIRAATERALERIVRDMVGSLLKGNPSANERYIADDVVLTMPDARMLRKKQAITDASPNERCLPSDVALR
jgi:hypothetical protein